ncbi:MAG: hypothetical protein JSC189_000041 [Candidatus Tokpelaia sp. JSC189]|nr:MAG: hypothetical protein JSC189_000041 [Candidatus Tokpelaia sp. JSC189]
MIVWLREAGIKVEDVDPETGKQSHELNINEGYSCADDDLWIWASTLN